MIFKKAFSLIELLMVLAIIGVLAGSGAWLMSKTIKNSVFIPNQLNMDKLANDTLDIMIEGDSQAHGLRFARVVSSIAANAISFTNQDGVLISYSIISNKISRNIAGVENAIPGYVSNLTGVTLSGKNGALFTYYDASNAVTATAAGVRRIEIKLIAITGTGLYNDWQGSSEKATSITVEKLQ